ncbi:MAG: hypothetical protein IPL46_17740 [Saprospiraceae bacterium]|nr:hypothetical protein [Saprospiraceae bacterium]
MDYQAQMDWYADCGGDQSGILKRWKIGKPPSPKAMAGAVRTTKPGGIGKPTLSQIQIELYKKGRNRKV